MFHVIVHMLYFNANTKVIVFVPKFYASSYIESWILLCNGYCKKFNAPLSVEWSQYSQMGNGRKTTTCIRHKVINFTALRQTDLFACCPSAPFQISWRVIPNFNAAFPLLARVTSRRGLNGFGGHLLFDAGGHKFWKIDETVPIDVLVLQDGVHQEG